MIEMVVTHNPIPLTEEQVEQLAKLVQVGDIELLGEEVFVSVLTSVLQWRILENFRKGPLGRMR